MIYRKATSKEGMVIMSMISKAVVHMKSKGINQWDREYPNLSIIMDDIDHYSGYVMVDEGEIAGYVCVNTNQPEEYEDVPWEDESGKWCVIHRLVVAVGRQGQGIAKKIIHQVEEQAQKDGFKSIRLDTYSGNPVSMELYPKIGFMPRGEIKFKHREEPFHVFEKLI